MCKFRIERYNAPPAPKEQGKATTGSVTLVALDPLANPSRQTVKVWSYAPFLDRLVKDAEADAKFETVPGKAKPNNPDEKWPDQLFLKSWDGVEAAKPERKPWKGGYGARSETDTLAGLASNARAHAIAFCHKMSGPEEKVLEILDDFATKDFDAMIELINRGKGKLA